MGGQELELEVKRAYAEEQAHRQKFPCWLVVRLLEQDQLEKEQPQVGRLAERQCLLALP